MRNFTFLLILLTSLNFYGQKTIKAKKSKNQISKTEVLPANQNEKPLTETASKTVSDKIVLNDESLKTQQKKNEKVETSDCRYFQNFKKENEIYKSTKLSLIYLRNFSGTNEKIYFSLAKKNEVPYLNIEMIHKGNDEEYGNGRCFDNKSKIIFTLKDGTTVTLMHIENEDCYRTQVNGVRDLSRNLSASFRFIQGNVEALRGTEIETMQILFTDGFQDYVIQTSVFAEDENIIFEPQKYFKKFMNCIDN